MGFVHESITLKNAWDVSNVRHGLIEETAVRQITVQSMVDTGTETLVISEALRQALGLDVVGEKWVNMANETGQMCQITEAVEVHWRDRFTAVNAVVLPGITEVLMGAITLEGLNVIVDPGNQQLVGTYGDKVILRVYGNIRTRYKEP